MELSIFEEVRALIGAPPAGLEFLEYAFCGFLLIFLVYSAVSFVAGLFRWIGGGM